ncbi:substrate-binding domain-containing protein [Streptomyces sp. LARHCF252]
MAVRHLVERGRRRIATITGPLDIQAGVDRLTGFHDVLRESGLAPSAVANGNSTQASGVAAMQQLLDQAPQGGCRIRRVRQYGRRSATRPAVGRASGVRGRRRGRLR